MRVSIFSKSEKIIALKRHIVLLWCAIFSIAMGYLECIVVIYLRELYYPDGFKFPLVIGMQRILGIEWIREFTTLIMLAALAIIAGKNKLQRFFYFFYCFGIWDIFYYIALKHLINWPESFLTFDILFLIPITWIGPVIAPLICSLVFVVFSMVIIMRINDGANINIKKLHWVFFYAGNFLVFISFIRDFGTLIIYNGYWTKFFSLVSDIRFQNLVATYIPESFLWNVFLSGEILVLIFYIIVIKSNRNLSR